MENPIGIRWFNDACYEIKLPNGKEILIDPYIDQSPNKLLGSEKVTGADYILISHTHFDHTLSLKDLSEKFDSKIFVGRESVLELAKIFDIPGYRLYGCTPGDVFELDDFKLEIIRGKHTKLGGFDTPSGWPNIAEKENIDPQFIEMNLNGSYEYVNYLLTLCDNTKMLIWGGIVTTDAIRRAKELRPNISIVQFTRDPLEKIAELYAAIGGQFVFPHHHDGRIAEGEDGVKALHMVAGSVAEKAPYTTMVLPAKGKWYHIKTSITVEE